MEPTATTSKLLLETGRSFATLQQRLRSDEDFQSLARQLGWDIPTRPAPLVNLLPQLAQLDAAVGVVVNEASLSNLSALKISVTAVFTAIRNLANETYTLPPPSDATAFKAEFPKQLLNVLLVEYLQTYHSQIYGLLYGTSLITREYMPASGGRVAYIRVSLNLHLLTNLLQDPTTFWRTVYGWGGAFAYERLVMAVREVLDRLGVPTGYMVADYDLLKTLNPGPIPSPEVLSVINALQVSLLHTLTILGELYLGMQLLPILSPTGTPQGVALAAQTLGTLNKTIDLSNNYFLTIVGEADLEAGIGLALQPAQPLQVKSLAGASAVVSGKFEVALQRQPAGVVSTPQLLLRTPGNTELTYETLTWKIGTLVSTTAAADIYTELKINALRFASGEGDNDSFLSQVLKNFYFKTDVSVGISKAKGFYFDAAKGLDSKQTKNIRLGAVHLNNVAFSVYTVNSFTYLTVATDLVADLGPIKTILSGVGLKAGIKYNPNGGDIGPFSTDIAANAPSGLGVVVESDLIMGEGYLYFNPAAKQYAGVAHLTLNKKIKLNALGLLQTELPEGRDGYSLLLLITSTGFKPIQLGLGFTLNGIGGLVGVNRAANVPYLRGLLYSGQMDQLLFPANVLDNPAAALALADSSFPATEGRYVFGLLAKIGWGAPKTLLTLDVGLIIELPAPVRLVLLGVLQATLPSFDKPILRLRADFLGTVDFGAGSIEFDATLRDSSILDRFPLSGDGAFRLYQGQNPVFLLTAGGFHPAFQPPANANLRHLQRLRLALADSRDFRLVLQTYLAITSNTVQVGARLDLFVDLPLGFSLEGYLYFDTLFEFNPFRLDVQIGAGVAIKRNGNNKLTLQLYLHVTGPAPWHVTGEVSFKLIFRVRFSINRTIGGETPAQPLPNVDVRQLLRQALAAPSSWEVQAPASAPTSPVVLRAEPDATRLLVDPGGALVVRQKVAPLAYPLERYGNARPENGNRFNITQAQLGTGTGAQLLTGNDLAEITDFFAPGEFRQMSEAQRLSAASFQLMRSGVRLRTLEGLTGGPATVQQVGYELLVLGSPVAAGTPIIAPTQPEAALVASAPVAEGTERRRMVDMPALQFQQLTQNSALSQSYATAQPSYLAPAEVYWQEDQYVLVRADTLTRYAATRYANEAQATAALQAVVAADARLRGELLVMPAYQLQLQSV